MTLIVMGHEVSRGGGGSQSKHLGGYSDDWDSYATAIGGCKKWHIGVGIGCCNVEGHLGHILYRGVDWGSSVSWVGNGLLRVGGCRWGGRREASASSTPCRLGGELGVGGEMPLPFPLHAERPP